MTPLSKRDQNLGATISFFAILLLLAFIVMPMVGFGDEMKMLLALASVLVSSLLVTILIVRKYRKENSPLMIDYLNIGTQRYILGLFMVFYGVPKLLGNFFDYQLFALDSKLAHVSEFELAWYFYGKNHWQELFSGIMEFIPGLLLLRRRTYYVAALILLPVTVQVFILNFFFKIGGITFPAATILLACNFYIIYSQKESIKQFFKSLSFDHYKIATGKQVTAIKWFRGLGILLLLLVLLIKLNPLLFKSAHRAAYQNLVGIYTLQEMKKNHHAFVPLSGSLYYKDLYIEKQARWNVLRRFDNRTEAFILNMNTNNDSIALYINKGGTGDGPDIIDSLTALKGTYKLNGSNLLIKGVQLKDTLELIYKRENNIHPKEWFW
jgi:hypothetical protein